MSTHKLTYTLAQVLLILLALWAGSSLDAQEMEPFGKDYKPLQLQNPLPQDFLQDIQSKVDKNIGQVSNTTY